MIVAFLGGFLVALAIALDEDVGWIKLTNSTRVSLPLSELAHAPD